VGGVEEDEGCEGAPALGLQGEGGFVAGGGEICWGGLVVFLLFGVGMR
jgi:hypothetical protein